CRISLRRRQDGRQSVIAARSSSFGGSVTDRAFPGPVDLESTSKCPSASHPERAARSGAHFPAREQARRDLLRYLPRDQHRLYPRKRDLTRLLVILKTCGAD